VFDHKLILTMTTDCSAYAKLVCTNDTVSKLLWCNVHTA
jgi:hypothetical protein